MKTTPLKAVDMTRRIRDMHYEQLKGKSHAERIAFYRQKAYEVRKKVGATSQEHFVKDTSS